MSVHYKFTADNSQLRKALNQTVDGLKGIEGQAGHTGASLQNMFRKGALAFGAYFGGRQLMTFARSIARVRAEFQDAETTMATFLQSGEKASEFIRELQIYANNNVFGFSDLTQASRQLLAFGSDIETVIPTIDRLSNIASATGNSLQDLVDLYGRARSMNDVGMRDLMRLGGMGLPIIEHLRQMGVYVDKNSVRFEHLQMVINSVTDEGGKFYGVMAGQMSNLSAEFGRLQNAVTDMFNEIGQRSEGAISTSVRGVAYLVENWERILRILAQVALAYGTYRAALMSIAVMHRLNTKATAASAVATRLARIEMQKAAAAGTQLSASKARATAATILLTRAQQGLFMTLRKINTAMKANIPMLVAAGIAALTIRMFRLVTAETAAERAARLHNNSRLEQREIFENLTLSLDKYIAKLTDSTAHIDDQARAFLGLQEAMPEVYGDMSFTQARGMSQEQLRILQREALERREINAETQRTIDLEKELKELQREYAINAPQFESSVAQHRARELRTQIQERQHLLRLHNEQIELNEAERERIRNLVNETQAVETLREARVRLYREFRQLYNAHNRLSESAEGTAEQFIASAEAVDRARKAYEELGGVVRGEGRDFTVELERNARSMARFAEDLQMSIEEGTISAMEEGLDRQLAQIEHSTRQRILAYDRQQEDLLERIIENAKLQAQADAEAAGRDWDERTFDRSAVEMPQDVIDAFEKRRQQQREQEQRDTERLYRHLTDQYKSFEERKFTIAEDFAERRELLERQLYNGSITRSQFDGRLETMNRAESDAIKQIEQEMLSLIDTSNTLFMRLFSDVSGKSRQTLQQVIDDTQVLLEYLHASEEARANMIRPEGFTSEQLNALRNDAQQIKAIYDGLIANMEELNRRNGFAGGSFVNAIRQFRNAARLATRQQEESNDELRETLRLKEESERRKAFQNLVSGAKEVLGITGEITGRLQELANATGNMQMAQSMQGIQNAVSGISSIAQGFKQGGWIGAAISAGMVVFDQLVGRAQHIAEQQRRMRESAEDYARALELIDLAIQNNDNVFGERSIQNAINAYEKAGKALEKLHDRIRGEDFTISFGGLGSLGGFGSLFGNLGAFTKEINTGLKNMSIITREGRNGFLGIGRVAQESSRLVDLAPEIFKDGGFNADAARAFLQTNQQITDEQRKQIQNAIDLYERYQEAMEAVREKLRGTFGSIAGDLISLITSSIQAGTDEWRNFQRVGSRAIEALGEQLMHELFLAAHFDQLQRDLEKSFNAGSPEDVANRQMQILDQFFDRIGQDVENAANFAKEWQQRARDRGFTDVWNDDIQGTAGKWQSLSQATGDALEGRFTAIQMTTANIDSTTREILQKNGIIAGIMGDASHGISLMVKQGEQQIKLLTIISKSTKKLDEVSLTLAEIKTDTQHLRI